MVIAVKVMAIWKAGEVKNAGTEGEEYLSKKESERRRRRMRRKMQKEKFRVN